MRLTKYFDHVPADVAGVYALSCTATNEKYVGSSNNLRRRAKEHFGDMRRNDHDNDHIQALHDKYGLDAFSFEILREVADKEARLDIEQQLIDSGEYILNVCPSARSLAQSDETRAKHRVKSTGRKLSPEACAKVSASKIGSKNYRYKGRYVTPFGEFESRQLAADVVPDRDISDVTIMKWCTKSDTVISAIAYGRSPHLRMNYSRDIIGKTYSDLGFDFIPK